MKHSLLPLISSAVAVCAILGSFAVVMSSTASTKESQQAAVEQTRSADSGPVIVELFTSQGCSSCPPADRLLSRLAEADIVAGVEVIPLAYHVDYWNYIGWQDPFSSSSWSQRQRGYARSLGHDRVYTPQLVVDGADDCVGSDSEEVERQIAQASRRPARGRVLLDIGSVPGSQGLTTEVSVTLAGEGRLDLMMAVFENGLETPVDRGENARRTLHNDFVVRRLERIASLDGAASPWASGSRGLVLDPSWNLDELGIAVFLQDPESLVIHGAAVAYPHRQGT